MKKIQKSSFGIMHGIEHDQIKKRINAWSMADDYSCS